MTYGPQSWADLIHLEGRIRKERQEMIYKQQEMRQKIVEVIAVVILVLLSIGVMGFIGTLLISKGN